MRTRKVVNALDICHHSRITDVWRDFASQLIRIYGPTWKATIIIFSEDQIREAITLSTAGPDRVNLMKGFVEALDAFGDDRPMFYLEIV